MWIRYVALGMVALAAGGAVAAGSFAFLLVIGIATRAMGRFKLGSYVDVVENSIMLGLLTGTVFSVFDFAFSGFWLLGIRHALLGLYGAGAGVFTGCVAMALAEILHTFPILFRRLRLKEGLPWIIATMAIGKTVGSLLYFICM